MNAIRGIYLMTCSLSSLDADRHSELAGRALRDLLANNAEFQKVHVQAIEDKPRFHEGFQQIAYAGQPLQAMESTFRRWLEEKGVEANEMEWDRYFFAWEVTEPEGVGVTTRYVLIYYHASS